MLEFHPLAVVDDEEIEYDGQTFPGTTVIVDPNSGVPWVLCDRWGLLDTEVSLAVERGAAGVLVVARSLRFWAPIEVFIETESGPDDLVVPPEGVWVEVEGSDPVDWMIAAESHTEPQAGTTEFVHLHAHSEFSALDGYATIDEMIEQVAADGQPAIALTDHGTCAGHPALMRAAEKAGIKPIYGVEAYFVDNRHDRSTKPTDYTHLILWALDDDGLKALWELNTEASRSGLWGKYPRMDWDLLERYATKGIAASTACLRGPMADDLLNNRTDRVRQTLARLMRVFDDRLYVELHTNTLDDQITLNERLVGLAREYDLPLIAVCDAHYACDDDCESHDVWMKLQTNTSLDGESGLFEGKQEYHLKTADEVRKALAYLGDDVVQEAMANTVALADRCTASIAGSTARPVFTDSPATDVEALIDLCMEGWELKGLPTEGPEADEYVERFNTEMDLLVEREFCGYYLIVSDFVRWAKRRGILVGPGRGSGGGSLVAYLSRITNIDPVEEDLLFERFLNPERDGFPDFDLDFPSSKRDVLQQYLRDRYGPECVVRIGSHLRLKSKGVVRKLASLFSDLIDLNWPDIDAFSNAVDEAEADTAGLGLPWEVLWEEFGDDLQPIRDRYPDMFAYADRLVGRLHSYGKHAAGFVISTDGSLADRIPQRNAAKWDEDPVMVSEWDMDALESLGFIKYDLLTIRNLDTIQQAADLVAERHGIVLDVDTWDEEYEDSGIWDDLSSGDTLGVFQVESNLGTQMCKRVQPRSVRELADVVSLGRPGPLNSGLTDTYIARRDGQEAVVFPHDDLEEVLGKTYGAMIYQEDVMAVCRVLADYSLGEADTVRRILGKKKVHLVEEEGRKFVRRAVDNGYDEALATTIWDQMAEFARYVFNRSHAFGYAVIAHWCAYFKHHYPTEYLTAILSTVDKDRVPEFVKEARRLDISVLPPDINDSGSGFVPTDEGVRYGLDSVKGVGEAATQAILDEREKEGPFVDWDGFYARVLETKGGAFHRGHAETLASVGAFDSIYPNRRALETVLANEKSGEDSICVFRNPQETGSAPREEVCTFDWDEEPPRLSERTQRPLKQKPLPKNCTKACRMYTAPPPLEPEDIEPYSISEIGEREAEVLGVHLSWTPFDRVPEDVWEETSTVEQIEASIPGSRHLVVGMAAGARKHVDRNGNEMGFAKVTDRDNRLLDAVLFSDLWEQHKTPLRRVGALLIVEVEKTERGHTLWDCIAL